MASHLLPSFSEQKQYHDYRRYLPGWSLRLQRKIHKCYQETRANNTQLVIYGKKGHAEVNGLVGQTEGTAIVIEKIEDLDRLDFTRAISLFSQTTKSLGWI